jgi:hypothetical protein
MNNTPLDSSFQCANFESKLNSPQFRSNRRQKNFSKKPRTFFQICTLKNHLNGRSSLIKHNMTMKIIHRWIPLFNALILSRKNFTSLFSFQRNSQKTKNLIFLLIFGSYTNK